ncbi:beta-galactosidase [Granulicella rosea]|uniref:Beta-galactosidase n=1 Tax=Granulicella rosea TaxID=474952 RepID=A0A239M021_9BACT|nr:glycoside hydrolase family 2 TIM barrel-domain containing protein [Granulicella rosea]SNT35249.1 beta-galactosidase [Granulicella rosea]
MPSLLPRLTRRSFLSRTAAVAFATAASQAPAASLLRFVDPANPGVSSARLDTGWEFFRGALDGPWEAWRGEEIASFASVTLPHCFNAQDGCDPDQPMYRGQAWYRTHLQPANPYPGGRTLLHFLGAGQAAQVWIGDKFAGKHVGGYDEFLLDITGLIAAAKPDGQGVRLTVQTDNSPDLQRLPSDLSDFSLYGGLYRPVSLVYVPAVAVEAVHIRSVVASDLKSAKVTVSCRFLATALPQPGQAVTTEVLSPTGRSLHRATTQWNANEGGFPGDGHLTTLTLDAPELWSPATPRLYTARVTVGDHTTTERFGVRHTEWVEHGPFKLNGERLLLRGTHRHEDHAGLAAGLPDALIRQEMQLIKSMGANFIRLAHYQQNRLVLELCDELGLLVWEELTWCRSGVAGEPFKAMAREKLHNLIDQHQNHPCVLMWGLGNEDDWPNEYTASPDEASAKQAIRDLMTELRDLAHALDPTRMTSFRRCDFARDIPDVYSPSIWAGWYGGRYTDYQKSLEKERNRVKHMIHIEWGADSHTGRHAEQLDPAAVAATQNTAEVGLAYQSTGGPARFSRDGDWSETYACELFDWHLKTQEQLPWLTGAAQWIFKDFTTPLRVENPIPRMNQKGLVERDLTPKEAFYVFQSYWTDPATDPMVRLYGHSWPVRWGKADQPRMVRVYSNCQTAELFLNGKSCGVKKRAIDDFPCAGLRWMLPFQPGRNTLRVVARNAAGKEVSDTIDFAYQTESWAAPAAFELKTIATTAKTTTVEATLHDAEGVLCLDSRLQVRFSLAGAGVLIDNFGTASGSRVVQLSNGRARITLERRGGASTLGIAAEGLPAAFHTIT